MPLPTRSISSDREIQIPSVCLLLGLDLDQLRRRQDQTSQLDSVALFKKWLNEDEFRQPPPANRKLREARKLLGLPQAGSNQVLSQRMFELFEAEAKAEAEPTVRDVKQTKRTRQRTPLLKKLF